MKYSLCELYIEFSEEGKKKRERREVEYTKRYDNTRFLYLYFCVWRNKFLSLLSVHLFHLKYTIQTIFTVTLVIRGK